ncbi:MAG: RnfABCDGE type electron transport complex subunit D [Candidatus Omnitrophota bacterium]|nr:MAG: RnfABCDGE type electron transport complex subunit D [Candidatus Omnitrophota bacterium]
MKEENLYISPGPHIFSKESTPGLMKDVIIALVPAIFASIYFFKVKAFILLLVSIVSCVVFEAAIQFLMKRKIAISDCSAIVTGILFAMVMPPSLPIWVCILGCFVAIGLAKQLFGGLGFNIFNPALLARAFLAAAFPTFMTRWNHPLSLDAVTGATPLGLVKFSHNLDINYRDLFIGNVSGSLGETSALALVIGGLYLLIKKAIDWRIPLGYIGTVFIISFLTNLISPDIYAGGLFHILAGGLLIGAIFMATDPVTSPVTKTGRWVFGIGCGAVTMVIRLWSGLPEGVMYAILLMNALMPLLNRMTRPRRYGT